MAKRAIFSLNVEILSDGDEQIGFFSSRSLLDADIILASPEIDLILYSSEQYGGKPLLSQSLSFRTVEALSHWRIEIKNALEGGKTVFFFLGARNTFYAYTGNKSFSGTGKNRVTTQHVEPHNNYEILPIKLDHLISRSGEKIKALAELGPLTTYWKDFGEHSEYKAYLDKPVGLPILATKSGGKTVGSILSVGKGHLVLLPSLDYDIEELSDYDEETDEYIENEKGKAFTKRLVTALVQVDKALKTRSEVTPPPDWTQDSKFNLESEVALQEEIINITNKIENLNTERTILQEELRKEGSLRDVLFEKGKPLESAIIEALKLFGFEAENYQNDESEFDAVFVSEEGRFIGEAEGRDNKAINIDKLSQLERELQEDFAREEVDEYANGVLFGNAYRFDKPNTRKEFFTTKCLSGAQRSKIALIRTIDLFGPAKYLKENDDKDFAKQCRGAIKTGAGQVVEFPKLPSTKKVKSS